MRVDQIIDSSLQLHGGRVAVEQRNERWTYDKLAGYAAKVSENLKQRRFSSGDRVILWMENSAEYIASYLAILRTGGVVVPVHAMTPAMEVLRIVRFSSAVCLITSSPHWKTIEAEFTDTQLRSVFQSGDWFAVNGTREREEGPDDLAQIIFTSGTTGQPKGVMVSHENLNSNIASILSYLRLTHEDSLPAVLPFVYAYGNSVMLSHLTVGARLVVNSQLVYPQVLIETMREKEVTGFSGVASHFAVMLRHPGFQSTSLPALRYMTSAGGPMPKPYLDKIRAAFPALDFHVMYGQTEATARLASLEPGEIFRKPGSAGRQIPGVSLKIIRNDGTESDPGEVGEIVASGKNVMKGYWRDPENTGKVLQQGWLHTGDLGYLDEEGYLYITGRSSEMIKSGGYRVDPAEIEEVLLRHPAIEEAGAVGDEDLVLGEVVVCFIVCKPGMEASKNEILAHCARNLAHYKCPRDVRFLVALPRSLNGKLLRRSLKDLLKPGGHQRTWRATS